MQKGVSVGDIGMSSYSLGIYGPAIDDRGKEAVAEIVRRSHAMMTLEYDPETFEFVAGDVRHPEDGLAEALRVLDPRKVILEATTLGFVELLFCYKALRELMITQIDILYVEPEVYRRSGRDELLRHRDFELSGDVPGYRAIPGHAVLLDDRKLQKGVFFVGYEEARLRRAFEDLQMIAPKHSTITFGVPAFRPGWEIDSLANNITVIEEKNIRGGIKFCAAENPMSVVQFLELFRRGLGGGEKMFVAPIGTKPHGIGVMLFVAEHLDVGVIYDHPVRKSDRSEKIAHWHLFLLRSGGDAT